MDVVISIKPEFVDKIVKGEKKYEFRKAKIKKEFRYLIIYSTKPEKKMIGYSKVARILEGEKSEIWEMTHAQSGINKKQFEEYYKGKESAIAYELRDIILFHKGIDPSEVLGNINAPQSYLYIKEEVINGIICNLV